MGRKSRQNSQFGETVAKILRDYREQNGVSYAQIAEILNTSRSQATRLINGERPMTIAELVLVCKGLGLKTSDVIAEAEGFVRRQPTPDHFTLAASEREPDPYEGLGEENQDV